MLFLHARKMEEGIAAVLRQWWPSKPVLLCSSLLCYFCASKVFLFAPTLLHKRKPYRGKRFDTVLIGHRGSRLEGLPENSAVAFSHAKEHGAQTIEFDVWLTKDDQVVVFHDGDLQRMTGCAGHVTELRLAELPPLLWPAKSDGSYLGPRNKQKIPTLTEALDATPVGTPIIIEFKMDSQLLVDKVLRAVRARGRGADLVWFSMQPRTNRRLGRSAPSVPRVTSVPDMLRLLLLYYAGLLPFVGIEHEIFGVPMDKVDYERIRDQKSLKGLPDWVCRMLAVLFSGTPPKLMIPSGMMKHLRKRGMPVWFLGVNSPADAAAALAAGATGLLSDRPAALAPHLRALGLLPPPPRAGEGAAAAAAAEWTTPLRVHYADGGGGAGGGGDGGSSGAPAA